MKKNSDTNEKDNSLSSTALAELIVDELVVNKLLKKEDFGDAVKIVTLEIDIRKTAGDY